MGLFYAAARTIVRKRNFRGAHACGVLVAAFCRNELFLPAS
jgi:hypothetical protein